LYVKNPETSTLGKKIIENSILLIVKLALRILPSKKLGDRIDLTKVLFTGILKANINSFYPILLVLGGWNIN
jgi:hypothetical protein